MKALSPNHWTAREFPCGHILKQLHQTDLEIILKNFDRQATHYKNKDQKMNKFVTIYYTQDIKNTHI